MLRRVVTVIIAGFLAVNVYGCVAVLAGAAGGGGTAFWLQGKLGQDLNVSSESTLQATKRALKAMKMEVTEETITKDIIQLMSKYADGRTTWIDIRPLKSNTSHIDIRVGMQGDKEAARKILDRVKRYL